MYGPWYVNMKDMMGREAYDRMQGVGRRASIKCFNCNTYGHYKNECPRPEPPLQCLLCAEIGHELQSCQLKVCGSCLKKAHNCLCQEPCISDTAMCDRCQRKGHIMRVCSDIWRRFHDTTESGERVRSVSVQKQREHRRAFCSNCAAQGHFHFECHLLQPADKTYSVFITKYEDQDLSEAYPERESLKAIKRSYSSLYTPSVKRTRYDAGQHSKNDSFPTIESLRDDDRYPSQGHSDHPVSSGQVQGSSYSQTFGDHKEVLFPQSLLDPPGPAAAVGMSIPPQSSNVQGVYERGNLAAKTLCTRDAPVDRPMKRNVASLLGQPLQSPSFPHPHRSALMPEEDRRELKMRKP